MNEKTRPHGFIWYELMTGDIEAATRFYGKVVGWTVQDSGQPGMDYRIWKMGDTPVSGLMAIPAKAAANGMQPTWLGYVHVDDVDADTARITAAGGAVHMPPSDIPGVGRMAMVADPQGAAFYVMAPTGAGPSQSYALDKPGHGGWHELHATDWQAAFDFYGQQFRLDQIRRDGYGPDGHLPPVQHRRRRRGRHDEQLEPAPGLALLL